MKKRILVLGATGMLGRIVYKYLKTNNSNVIVGSSREKSNPGLIFFDVRKTNIDNFLSKNRFDFVINCIGALKGSNKNDLVKLNSLFPKKFDMVCSKLTVNLIHISTDAVFADKGTVMSESSKASTYDEYGKSKLDGEVLNGLNIRTSLLGLDPKEHKGILELMLSYKKIKGFTNQIWSGATTLQVAEFVYWLMSDDNYENLIKKTHIIHFAPIESITKYRILETFSELVNGARVIKKRGPKRTRILNTKYVDEIELKKYTKNLKKALKELIKFDEKYLTSQKK